MVTEKEYTEEDMYDCWLAAKETIVNNRDKGTQVTIFSEWLEVFKRNKTEENEKAMGI